MSSKFRIRCRIGLDWIACVVQMVALLFYTIGFATNYWAESSDSSIHVGLFTACDEEHCYDTHVFYDGKSGKGSVMGTAVLQIFTIFGLYFVLFLMLLYMFGLFDEKSVGRGAAITAYVSGFLGFLSIIIYGSAISTLSYTLSWSFAFVVLGLIINLSAGICIHIGSHQWVESKQKRPFPIPTFLPSTSSSRLPSRLDPRLEPRPTDLGKGNQRRGKFNPKQSPKLSRKILNDSFA